jgi:hypothetical protein
MQQMVKLLLGLDAPPSPHDAADALAVAICHVQASGPIARLAARSAQSGLPRSWRNMKPDQLARRQAP